MRVSMLLIVALSSEVVSEPAKDDKLRQELLRRMDADQEARKRFLTHAGHKRLKEIDRDNTARMKEIVKQFGWPGKSLVGADGANAAWLLVQHADQDPAFQKQCLKLLRSAVKKGEATGVQLAYLTDRVRLAEKKKQVYGTQFRLVDGKAQPQPIEDEANVDRRRKEIGLSSLAEYLKQAQAILAKQRK